MMSDKKDVKYSPKDARCLLGGQELDGGYLPEMKGAVPFNEYVDLLPKVGYRFCFSGIEFEVTSVNVDLRTVECRIATKQDIKLNITI